MDYRLASFGNCFDDVLLKIGGSDENFGLNFYRGNWVVIYEDADHWLHHEKQADALPKIQKFIAD
ncbi:MAG: hypothetical protein AB7O96_05060 [Pseudobdellovibrionaceae bacterium]